jgi:putative integral membrane protein (TIGR02587 family)
VSASSGAGNLDDTKTARDVFAGLARGFGGSILFALPLLMTMEMWWLGFYLAPVRILLLMAIFFPVLVGVAHYIGFGETTSLGHAALHTVTAYAVAIVSSAVMLGILGVLKPGMGWHELVGKTAIQAGPGALGALLAQSHFGASDAKDARRQDASYVEHMFFMIVGALFVALTVAPTDEMPLIGYMMRNVHTLVAVAFSLALLHFFAHGVGFEGHAAAQPGGAVSTFFRLAVVGYALALAVSAFLLYVFGRFDDTQIAPALHTTVALGLPAAIGAAAARILLDA